MILQAHFNRDFVMKNPCWPQDWNPQPSDSLLLARTLPSLQGFALGTLSPNNMMSLQRKIGRMLLICHSTNLEFAYQGSHNFFSYNPLHLLVEQFF